MVVEMINILEVIYLRFTRYDLRGTIYDLRFTIKFTAPILLRHS